MACETTGGTSSLGKDSPRLSTKGKGQKKANQIQRHCPPVRPPEPAQPTAQWKWPPWDTSVGDLGWTRIEGFLLLEPQVQVSERFRQVRMGRLPLSA